MSDEWLGCGHSDHTPDCLCDVVITNPLPPITELYRGDVVSQLWMGKELADLKEYCIPWDDNKILDFFEDLVKFYDAYHDADGNIVRDSSALVDMEPLLRYDDEQLMPWWGRIRHAVQFAMDHYDNSIDEILEHLQVTPQEFMEAATTNKAGDGWDVGMLLDFDKALMNPPLKWKRIARVFDLTVSTARGLDKYWSARRLRIHGSDNPARDYFQKLCLETDMSPKEIEDEVYNRYGVVYNSTYVRKYRSRVRRGDLQN